MYIVSKGLYMYSNRCTSWNYYIVWIHQTRRRSSWTCYRCAPSSKGLPSVGRRLIGHPSIWLIDRLYICAGSNHFASRGSSSSGAAQSLSTPIEDDEGRQRPCICNQKLWEIFSFAYTCVCVPGLRWHWMMRVACNLVQSSRWFVSPSSLLHAHLSQQQQQQKKMMMIIRCRHVRLCGSSPNSPPGHLIHKLLIFSRGGSQTNYYFPRPIIYFFLNFHFWY